MDTLESAIQQPGTITELAARIGVHQSSALRYLRLLEERGWVRRDQDGKFHGGYRIIELGQAALEGIDLRAIAKDRLAALSHRTGQTVHLAVLDGSRVVYVEKYDAPTTIRMYSRIGAAAPLHCTGVAKAVLAWSDRATLERLRATIDYEPYTANTLTDWPSLAADLERARARGFAIDNCEHEQYIHCVAAPLRDSRSGAIGAISITAATVLLREDLLRMAPDLVGVADDVSKQLGWRPPADAEDQRRPPRETT